MQDWDEWVVLLAGEARLLIEGESDPRTMQPGDWINLPAGVQHRVESTSKDPPTIWLALHYHRHCRSENRTHPPCRVQPSSQAGTE